MKLYSIAAMALAAIALGQCTTQQQANLQNAAIVSCNAAQIAADASVAITADVGASTQAQTDAVKAVKVTNDACSALAKLPSVAATPTAPSSQAQAIYRQWYRDMPKSVLNSAKFQKYIEKAAKSGAAS